MAKEFLYKSLARQLEGQIRDGTYRSGQKLPSINRLTETLDLSVNTVFKAYVELELAGLVEARPRSGYYVRPKALETDRRKKALSVYDARRDQPPLSDVIRTAIERPKLVPFGRATIWPGFFPKKKMAGIAKTISAKTMESLMNYGPVRGSEALRRQLARRMLGLADGICPDQILITNGCREAVAFSLMAVTCPGDTIAIESPTFFGYMQMLRELNLSIIEIPTSPDTGMDLDALERAIDTGGVAACLLVPNFHNPLGFVMPDDRKEALVRLTNRRGVPVIEDDIYSELHFGKNRPGLLKAFDRKGLVITCSSFSKTLSPGFRIGWVLADLPLLERIEQIKLSISMATTCLDQFLLAEFMAANAYDRHLRSMRGKFQRQVACAAKAVDAWFPEGTTYKLPDGGFVLWLALPEEIDGMTLYEKAMDKGIAILPGSLCAFSGKFKNCIRINCGFPHDSEIEDGFRRLGELAVSLAGQEA